MERIRIDSDAEPDPNEWFGEGARGPKPPLPGFSILPDTKSHSGTDQIPSGSVWSPPTDPQSPGGGSFPQGGTTVKHPTYGLGQDMELSGLGALRKVKIRFQTAGIRSFILDKAQLELVGKGRS